jgi:hypothetical protein
MLPDSDFFLPTLHAGNRREIGREVYGVPTFRVGIPSAGVYYVNLAGICKPGVVNFGLALQASVALQVSITLDCEDLVRRDPTQAIWHPDITTIVNALTPLVDSNGSVLFGNVMRVTATGAGILLVGAC